MSYPPPVYHGDSGEKTAWLRPGDAEPELPLAKTVTSYLATGAQTDGKFGLYRWDFLGPLSGPDPHFHRAISESFFILAGTVRLYDATPGWTPTPETSSTFPKAGSTASATSPANPRPCFSCSHRGHPARGTSRACPSWPNSTTSSGRRS